jgi:hypothetical protein
MFKKNPIIWVLEWLGHYQTIQTIIQAHFVRTLLLPVVTAVAAAVFGWIEHIPLMWVIMAVALAFMGAMQGVLSSSEYLERKNPVLWRKRRKISSGNALDDGHAPRFQSRSRSSCRRLPG